MTTCYFSAATIVASYDLAGTDHAEPQGVLAQLVRRYRSVRSAVVVGALERWIEVAQPELPAPERRGIVLGTATGAGPDIAHFLAEAIRAGDHLVNPALFPMTVHNAAAGNAALATECRGPNVVVSAGSDSAWAALATGRSLLDDGSADIVFVGGFESAALADGTSGTVAAFLAIASSPGSLGQSGIGSLGSREARTAPPPPAGTPQADSKVVGALLDWATTFQPSANDGAFVNNYTAVPQS